MIVRSSRPVDLHGNDGFGLILNRAVAGFAVCPVRYVSMLSARFSNHNPDGVRS
jgi:hypothetical protein